MTSPLTELLPSHSTAFATHTPTVSASLRQGMTIDNSISPAMSGVPIPLCSLEKDVLPGNVTSVACSLVEEYIDSFDLPSETRTSLYPKATFLPAFPITISTAQFVKSEKSAFTPKCPSTQGRLASFPIDAAPIHGVTEACMIEQLSPPPARAASSIQWWPRFFVIWFCIAALLIGSHLGFYFKQPYYEGGDFAANALQIRKAKVFHELYGNYSRWGFHHPGPAFFYAYAAGEVVLFDALKVVPSPFNAHLLIGVLLQSLFFAWAVAIVSKHVRRPLLVPLLLIFAGV